MSKKYLIITSMSGAELATVCDSHDDAVDYINQTTNKWGDTVTEIRKIADDNYKVSFHNGVYLTMAIKAYDETIVKFHLAKYDHEKYIETRRFSSRANAVKFVEKEFDKYDYDADEEETEVGEWELKDEDDGLNLKFVLLVVIIGGESGSKYHDILGIKKTASKDEIKAAYKKKAKENHPDMGGDDKKFREVNEAYNKLINDEIKGGTDNFSEAYPSANVQYILDKGIKKATTAANESLKEEARRVAIKKIMTGLAWAVGGTILTIINPYFIFWGAIVFGVWDILRGLYWLANPQALVDKVMQNLGQ
jgi:hypothetical protein